MTINSDADTDKGKVV